jgi:hypothetical protein
MDEEEKPFPIEFIVILLIIAIANDVAEVFFDFLDFTGVGITGEAIMEPANLVLDFFFTGIFWWKVGLGGGTITQYIGDLLEPFFIPGRTISVALGLWIANNPSSVLGKAVTAAASLESGNVGGAASEAEETAEKLEGPANAEKKLENENAGAEGAPKTKEGENATAQPTPPEGESAEKNENAPENDVFKNPYDNPMGTAQEEEFSPSEDAIQEGKGFSAGAQREPQESENQPQRAVDISSRRPPAPQKQNPIENASDKDLDEAA